MQPPKSIFPLLNLFHVRASPSRATRDRRLRGPTSRMALLVEDHALSLSGSPTESFSTAHPTCSRSPNNQLSVSTSDANILWLAQKCVCADFPCRDFIEGARLHRKLLRATEQIAQDPNYARFSLCSRDTHLLRPRKMRVALRSKNWSNPFNELN